MTKPSSNRSHQFSYANHAKSTTSQRDRRSKPDGSALLCLALFMAILLC
jgi:hypothetical protein